jgi:hypothetical protein
MGKPASLEDFTDEQRDSMAATYKSLIDNPETRELALRLTKKVNPEASIPEIELKDAARAEFKRIADRQDAADAKLLERDAEQRVKEARLALREQGFSKEDIAAIETIIIEEKKNGNHMTYDLAARFYANSKTVAEPTPVTQAHFAPTLPQDAAAAMKSGKKGLNAWALDSAAKALAEIQAGRVKLH